MAKKISRKMKRNLNKVDDMEVLFNNYIDEIDSSSNYRVEIDVFDRSENDGSIPRETIFTFTVYVIEVDLNEPNDIASLHDFSRDSINYTKERIKWKIDQLNENK